MRFLGNNYKSLVVFVLTLRRRGTMESNRFINRERSWLDFNGRVLEEAMDTSNKIMERLKFASIVSSNLDEFFMVRVAGVKTLVKAKSKRYDISGKTPKQEFNFMSEMIHAMVDKQYMSLNRSILPTLKKNNIRILKFDEISDKQKTQVKKYFDNTVYPILTPMAIDKSRPLPLLNNKSLNFIITIKGDNDKQLMAVMQVPTVIPRIIKLNSDNADEYIMLEEVIRKYAKLLFRDKKIVDIGLFRITRNSEMDYDDDDDLDLLHEIEKGIKKRKRGSVIRLEVEKCIDKNTLKLLQKIFKVDKEDTYIINGIMDLTVMMKFASNEGSKELRNEPIIPRLLPSMMGYSDIFEAIRNKDHMLHHPYHTFDYVVDFVKQASVDPDVLAIKQTLYRVSGNSPIVKALIKAAENGKQVTVLIELKARFDEENNISFAKELEKAGCHVIYGLKGLKTHCKVCQVVRQEGDIIRRYVHLSTGNYNDTTAKLYTDIGFFSCDEMIGEDTTALFNVLTGYSDNNEWNKLCVAPTHLQKTIIELINRETENAKNGKKGKIIMKMNSLVDKRVIEALYTASSAGVEIQLIVRGICCLRSGVPELSENITVVSIIDRFLEHSRVFYFYNDKAEEVYLSSADMMPRNLYSRVEIMFPIEQKDIKERAIGILDESLRDTVKLRVQQSDGTYKKRDKRGKKRIQSQLVFCKQAAKEEKAAREALKKL